MKTKTIILVILTVVILSIVLAGSPDLGYLVKSYYPFVFLFYLLAGLALRMPVAISVGAGAILLFSALIFTLAGKEETSGQLSIYAFLFFAVGLVWALVKYIAKEKDSVR